MQRKDRTKAESISDKANIYHKEIVDYLDNSSLQKLCYARKSRVKSKTDILNKWARKKNNPEKLEYKIEKISDIIGIRFIVLFKQDIIEVIQSIVNILIDTMEEGNPFRNCTIEELIYYKGNISVSDISARLKECFSLVNKEMIEIQSSEGYSSIHIVCNLYTEDTDVLPEGYKIPVEIQVRTIFEDAWGEIDHKYGYKVRRDNSSFHPTLDKHLKTLKHFIDACVDYADLIVDESDIELNPTDFSRVLNIPESLDNIDSFFKSMNIEVGIFKQYKETIKKKDTAIDNNDTKNLFVCAEEFLSIKNKYLDKINSSEDDKFTFYCSLNYAFCYLVSNTERGIKNAQDMYLNLHSNDEDNSLVLMRLGQTYGKTKDYDKSIELLMESYYKAKRKNSRFEVKSSDAQYVLVKAPKTAGYFIWLKVQSSLNNLDSGAINRLYQSAYEYTKQGFETLDKSVHSIDYIDYQNNLVFYLTEINKTKESVDNTELIKEKLSEIEEHYDSPELIDATILHTLANAYSVLKDIKKFTLYSNILKTKIFENKFDFDDSKALEMLAFINNNTTK